MPYTTLFFDLDDTLYNSACGLWDAIRQRMSDYMAERLGLPQESVPSLRRSYYERYGTTLRGLQVHHKVDVDDFLAYVHDLPLANFLQPSPQLRLMLLSLPQSRWIFTNADEPHARRVLDQLGLQDVFAGIIDIRALNFTCKPDPLAYQAAMQRVGEQKPEHCVLLDDSPRNLAAARLLGITTVLVGSPQPHPSAVYSIPNLLALPQAMPALWSGENHGPR